MLCKNAKPSSPVEVWGGVLCLAALGPGVVALILLNKLKRILI